MPNENSQTTTKTEDDPSNPKIIATIQYEMPVPKGATEEKAIEAAEEEFSDIRESNDASLELEYADPETN